MGDIYHRELIKETISIPYNKIGKNVVKYFKYYYTNKIQGRCKTQGYVKSDNFKILTYSAGLIDSDNVLYQVHYEGLVCKPFDNMKTNFIIKNINKLGARAIYSEIDNPIMAFITREHNENIDFDNLELEQIVHVTITGNRYELNDDYITVIGTIDIPPDESTDLPSTDLPPPPTVLPAPLAVLPPPSTNLPPNDKTNIKVSDDGKESYDESQAVPHADESHDDESQNDESQDDESQVNESQADSQADESQEVTSDISEHSDSYVYES